ncbi:MAG TPA: PRC-barrel domain-containing protein [Microvirga sp.]|nr:PRC-barrel domain-containing protein [Microvirga sp.]
MRRFLPALAAAVLLAGGAHAQTTAPSPAPTTPAGPATATMIPDDAILSGQIEDIDLRNAANEDVGEIEDAVISQGRIVGYVISVGGFLGVGDRNVFVEPSMITLSYSTTNNRWEARINATREQLQAAQEFKYEGRWDDD